MNLGQFITHVTNLTEENPSLIAMTNYVNDGIAKLNTKAGAIFPFLEANVTSEFPIPETYIRTILVPFVAGRIKAQDGSQFEYTDYYAEFREGLGDFVNDYSIPDEYNNNLNQTTQTIEMTYGWGL